MTIPAGRDNGLPPARRYDALVEVDGSMADEVLELLRAAGVTAIAETITTDAEPGNDLIPVVGTLPRVPHRVRVHVDSDHTLLAHSVLGHAMPQLRADFHAVPVAGETAKDRPAPFKHPAQDLAPGEVESRFADIVSGFDMSSIDIVPRWSVREDSPEATGATDPSPKARPPLSSRLIRRGAAPAGEPRDIDTSEHFVPEPPPPLPETDRVTRMAWAALMGGPALLVLAALLGIGLESWVVVLALGGFLGGFGTLIARMRDRPRQDDGWDDGAVL